MHLRHRRPIWCLSHSICCFYCFQPPPAILICAVVVVCGCVYPSCFLLCVFVGILCWILSRAILPGSLGAGNEYALSPSSLPTMLAAIPPRSTAASSLLTPSDNERRAVLSSTPAVVTSVCFGRFAPSHPSTPPNGLTPPPPTSLLATLCVSSSKVPTVSHPLPLHLFCYFFR